MSKKIYQIVCNNLNIDEVVKTQCPLSDQRRLSKPDEDWLPKIKDNNSTCTVYWTAQGLKKYTLSGLRDWHLSLVSGNCKIIVAEKPDEIVYEDEYRVVFSSHNLKIIKITPFQYCGPIPFIANSIDLRPEFIRHHSSIRDWNSYAPYTGSDESFTLMSSFAEVLGLKKIGIHHEILPPGKRSSWPHAHKVEEELVYILKGNPTLWINGKIFNSKPGDSLFFPPGTNLAHTIINNTDVNVEMLVFGEQNQTDDLLYYPLHSDRNLECKLKNFLWEDRPSVEMGNHNGIAGLSTNFELVNWEFQKNIKDVPIVEKKDIVDKIFYKNKDLGRTLGAKRVALHWQILPSGFRSSLPHAESDEEEFIYVLKGSPIVWVNGERYQLNAGDAVAFPSGTGICHTFINESKSDVEFLVSGETTKKENKCFFPLNPEQKETCGIWWENSPVQKMGISSPFPV